MGKNDRLVEEIGARTGEVLAEMEARDLRPFPVTAVRVEHTDVMHDGVYFSEEAKKSLLGMLRVKQDFPEQGEAVERQRWSQAIGTILAAQGDQDLWGLYGEVNGQRLVKAIYPRRPNTDNATRHREIMGALTGALIDTDREFELAALEFDAQRDTLDVSLLETAPFRTLVDDSWKGGCRFVFNALEFDHYPFFKRLSCANGATTKQYGNRTRVSQKKHSIAKVAEVVRRSIVDGNGPLNDIVVHAVNHLSGLNASVAEFEGLCSAVKKALAEDEANFQRVSARYFDDSHIREAYGGAVLEDQSRRWKQSANSGVNAYDMFNLVTWLGSHPAESGISSHDQQLALQVSAANYLFKERLDMEDVPPLVTMPQHRLPEME